MSTISTILSTLRSAVWAIDVRDEIANAIEQCYKDVNSPSLVTDGIEEVIGDMVDNGRISGAIVEDLGLITEGTSNLFDFTTVTAGRLNTSTGEVGEASGYWTSDFIPVENGKTYYFANTDRRVAYNSSKAYSANISGTTWTASADGYIRVSVTSANRKTAKINEGSAKDYRPGRSPIDFNLRDDVYRKAEVDAALAAVTIATDPELETAGAAADAKATGDAISALNESLNTLESEVENSTVISQGSSQGNMRYKYGTGFVSDTTKKSVGYNVSGYEIVEIATPNTYGDETNLYPNVTFFSSSTASASTEIAPIYIGDVESTGWKTRISVPSGATYMYVCVGKFNSSVVVTGINTLAGSVDNNAANISNMQSRMSYTINNIGYAKANELHVTNFYNSETEYSATAESSARLIKVGTTPWNNPAEKHVGYSGMWIKSTVNAVVYILIHTTTSMQDEIEKDMAVEGGGGVLHNYLIVKKAVTANTWTYLYNTFVSNGGGSTSTNNSLIIVAMYEDAETAATATLYVKKGVFVDLSASFGMGYEPTAEGMKALLDGATDYYITENYNIFSSSIMKGVFERRDIFKGVKFYSPDIEINDENQLLINSYPNKAWSGWNKPQYGYAMGKTKAPININVHGGVESDSYFSVIPVWGPWTEWGNGTTCLWGGHVFHGWNSAQTYRLTMMASGNMSDASDPNFIPREDEFCIQVFSPSSCYAAPVDLTPEQAENRVVQEDEDKLSGGHYYGRVRIGADTANRGFVFRAKSMKCYGRIDLNGNRFIMGTQNAPTSSSSTGAVGQISYDSNYLYVCVAENTWKRIPLTSF